MTREAAAYDVAKAIGEVARALHAIKLNFPPEQHGYFSSLLSTPSTQEEFTLPTPERALLVCIKNLHSIGRDIPAIAGPVQNIIESLTAPAAPAGPAS